MKKYFNKFSESTKRMIVIISVTLMISSIIIAVVAIILYKDLEYLRGPRMKYIDPITLSKTKTNDLFMMDLKITDHKSRKYIEGEINNQSFKNYTYAYIIIGLYNNKKRSIGFAKTTIYDIPSRRSKEFKIPIDKKVCMICKVF